MRIKKSAKQHRNSFYRASRLIPVGAILLVLGFAGFSLSKTANAGLVSLISGFLGNQSVSAETQEFGKAADSQTSQIIVLQAPVNSSLGSFSPDIPPLDDGTTLSPDIARMNTVISEPINTQISTYIVREGDTVSGVAKMFNVSVSTVLWANSLNSRSVLQAGQTLVILPVTGITYKVRSGDTLSAIAKKYKADEQEILAYNDLDSAAQLKVGSDIIIPSAEISESAATSGAGAKSSVSSASYFVCPVRGARLSQGLHGHNGVDLAIAVGTPVRAVASGIVIINRSSGAWNGGYGNFVVILHPNGTQSLYSHMSRSNVANGEKVAQGDVVGYVGMTGLTTGPHLHFEIRGASNPFTSAARCR